MFVVLNILRGKWATKSTLLHVKEVPSANPSTHFDPEFWVRAIVDADNLVVVIVDKDDEEEVPITTSSMISSSSL